MIDLFDSLYSVLPRENIFFRTIRYIVRVSANNYIRYFLRTKSRKQPIDKDTVIVSLTSFPARIGNVWMTVKTLLNQQGVDNFKVILWLSKEEFPHGMDSVPANLKKLAGKGLEIRMVEKNLRPHKKYIYAFKEFPDNGIVTVDDDILYPSTLVKSLVDVSSKFPNCVVYHRGREIGKTPYNTWTPIKESLRTASCNFPTGVGGVLYPPHCYIENIFDEEAIRSTCLAADDLWLSVMCRMKGTKTVHTGSRFGYITILSSQEEALMNTNCNLGRNDVQIEKISEWLKAKFGVDFYVNIDRQ